MKKLLKSSFVLAFVATSLFLTSCTNENEGIFDPTDPTPEGPTIYNLIVNPTNTANTDERNVQATAAAGGTITVNANFTGEKTMRRLYMTKNNFSENLGAQPYEYPLGSKKSDGSINLDGDDKKEFTFQFTFDAPENEGEIVQYVLWTTRERGDFRDISNDNAIADDAYGTITIKAGASATGSSADFRSFTQTILAAPLADGTSKTFVSVYNNETYKISEGEETAALWDFGYLYGTNSKAGFYSASDFPLSGFGGKSVEEVSGVSKAELNKCYFTLSTKTTAEFDAANNSSDLNNSLSTSSSQRIQNLEVGSVVAFVDQYGNQGLIKVTAIVPGNGTAGRITFNVKVQVNAIPVKL